MERIVLARSLAWRQRLVIGLIWLGVAGWLVVVGQAYQPTAPLVVDLQIAWLGR